MLKSYRLKRAAKRAIRELESSLRQLDQIAPESGDEIRMLIGEAQIRSQRISELLGEIQAGIAGRYGTGEKPLDLVFHGGSGSTDEEIATAVENGVVKMNIDTDTQYAYTRSVAHSMISGYEGVLKLDGEVGNKRQYDPRAWGKASETAMASRVVDATRQLGSASWSGR